MPIEFDKSSLRQALGLPNHDLFSQGIFHNFESVAATNPNQEDYEHMNQREGDNDSD